MLFDRLDSTCVFEKRPWSTTEFFNLSRSSADLCEIAIICLLVDEIFLVSTAQNASHTAEDNPSAVGVSTTQWGHFAMFASYTSGKGNNAPKTVKLP